MVVIVVIIVPHSSIPYEPKVSIGCMQALPPPPLTPLNGP